jgi:CDP-diacylglycerol--glycerol-3-phosphate 3-phosphatidyltransferase
MPSNNKNLNIPNILAAFRVLLAPLMLWFLIDRNNPLFTTWHPSWLDYFAGLIFCDCISNRFF